MLKQAKPRPSNLPADMCPVATDLSQLLPGDWRAMRPKVDRDKCVKCATCWLFCPVQCIVEKKYWFDVNYATCKGCGVCAEECPHNAIVMIKEAEG